MAGNDPMLFIRESVKDIFPEGVVSGSVLLSNIAFGAAALGAGHIEICDANGWWFAASETNWLEKHLPKDTQVKDLFLSPVPFPQLSPTSFRPEIYVAAFANRIYLDLNGKTQAIKNTLPANPLPHLGVVPPWCHYVLACQPTNNAKR